MLWINPGLPMIVGKAMAQGGHAAQLAWWASDAAARARWRAAGFPLVVRTATPSRWTRLVRSGVPVVADGGFTEVESGSLTAAAQAPWLGG